MVAMRSDGRSRPRVWRRVNLEGAALLLLLLVLWQVAKASDLLTSQFLPSPTQIVSATGNLINAGTLAGDLWHTLYVTLVGWLIAGALGLAFGLLLGLSRTAWRYSMASVEFLRALPAISFVPVAVLLFGFSVKTELMAVVYVSMWPILINTIHGARGVTPLHDDLGRMLQFDRVTRIRRLVLPTTLPHLLVGLQFALSLALALALVAEMIGNPQGVGHGLITAQNTLQPGQMFSYVLLVGAMGLVLNALFVWGASTAFPSAASALRTGI